MGFDIILKSISAEGLVWQPNFARARQAKISVQFLSIVYYLWSKVCCVQYLSVWVSYSTLNTEANDKMCLKKYLSTASFPFQLKTTDKQYAPTRMKSGENVTSLP